MEYVPLSYHPYRPVGRGEPLDLFRRRDEHVAGDRVLQGVRGDGEIHGPLRIPAAPEAPQKPRRERVPAADPVHDPRHPVRLRRDERPAIEEAGRDDVVVRREAFAEGHGDPVRAIPFGERPAERFMTVRALSLRRHAEQERRVLLVRDEQIDAVDEGPHHRTRPLRRPERRAVVEIA